MTLVSARGGDLTLAPPSPMTMALKRTIDIIGALVGFVLLSPVFAAVAVIIRLDSRGPVFFRQERIGHGGRPFVIFKFRSMRIGAARMGAALTVHEDKRVTRFGAFLRRSKLDELPQLINVLAGDMSLVGPRPEVPEFIKYYAPEQRAIILSTKPGMTDYAAIRFRDESALLDSGRDPVEVYRYEIMPIKFVYYERYSRQISVLNDLRIIFATVSLLVAGRVPHWLGMEDELQAAPVFHKSKADNLL
jgi:lipopolysaccharide/colanic/teichoic acid biosynthesis glycosyltransferase